MGKCIFKTLEDGIFKEYSCYDLDNLKEMFRLRNKTDLITKNGGKDRAYEAYCKSLEEIVKDCNCVKLKCDKCSLEDHEGHFCRCEDRNIELAKHLREIGKSPTKTDIY